MGTVEAFWKLGAHSDRELLKGLRARVGNGRQLMAEVLAHLGEVEERRLHLHAGYSSMFAYCVSRLGMSEDEACRRIDVSRLARRHPSLFMHLASGRLSLSVAALLKPHLTTQRGADEQQSGEWQSRETQSEQRQSQERQSKERAISDLDVLVAAVSSKTVQQAREALAALFPRPDVESSIRKLPQRSRAVGASPATPECLTVGRAALSHAPQPAMLDPGRGDTGSEQADHDRTAMPEGVSTLDEHCATSAERHESTSAEHAATTSAKHVAPTSAEQFSPTSAEHVAPTSFGPIPPTSIGLLLDRVSGPEPHLPGLQFPAAESAVNLIRPSTSPTGSPGHHLAANRPEGTSVAQRAPQPFVLEPSRSQRIEPLSPGRYRVQFTADAALKDKLELARDLMRHTLPGGDLAAIVSRSLDLLIEQLMKRRFGAAARRQSRSHETCCPARPPTSAKPPTSAEQPADAEQTPSAQQTQQTQQTSSAQPRADQPPSAHQPADADQRPSARQTSSARQSDARLDRPSSSNATSAARSGEAINRAEAAESSYPPPSEPTSPSIDRATRRAVLERDGLQCTWRSEDGRRCEARAWLEYDHVRARARGGSSSAKNTRLLCRPHNRLAAEQEFGRQHVEEAIAAQRAKRRPGRASP